MYTPESDVVNAGATLLLVAAVFQLFDGLQVVATGALRGAGNTRIPMIANFIGYWVIGLPLGAFLCFKTEDGSSGHVAGLVSGSCADRERTACGVAGDDQETHGDKSNSKRSVVGAA